MSELLETLGRFIASYNRLGAGRSDKNSRFLVFYTELLSAVATDLKITLDDSRTAFLYLIGYLVQKLHQWDDYIDEKHMDPKNARWLTYGTYETEVIGRALDRCNLGGWRGIEKALDVIESYFGLTEVEFKTGPSRHSDEEVLWLGNCDFQMYNAVLFAYIRKFRARGTKRLLGTIECWMRAYLPLDLILDDFYDFEDDRAKSSPNILAPNGEAYLDAWKSGRLTYIASLGSSHAVEAEDLTLDCPYPATREVLSVYGGGAMMAVETLGDFLCFHHVEDGDRRTELFRLLLKPHPWERMRREEAQSWIEQEKSWLCSLDLPRSRSGLL